MNLDLSKKGKLKESQALLENRFLQGGPPPQSDFLLPEACDAHTCPKVCIYRTAQKVLFFPLKSLLKSFPSQKRRNNMLGKSLQSVCFSLSAHC